jgi:hypothetical protein
MLCKICNIRRPRRPCPAVGGEICSQCCGREREVTLNCPLDCQYLLESRKHDKPEPVQPDRFPNQDIRVTETFLRDHEPLLTALGRVVLFAALETPGAVDFDVREALAALIRTHRTLESGLYYETRPENTVAAELDRRIQESIAEFRRGETERQQITKTRDSEVLIVLVFLQRLEIDRNNGRKRGRAFIDFLRGQLPGSRGESAPAATPSLIVT